MWFLLLKISAVRFFLFVCFFKFTAHTDKRDWWFWGIKGKVGAVKHVDLGCRTTAPSLFPVLSSFFCLRVCLSFSSPPRTSDAKFRLLHCRCPRAPQFFSRSPGPKTRWRVCDSESREARKSEAAVQRRTGTVTPRRLHCSTGRDSFNLKALQSCSVGWVRVWELWYYCTIFSVVSRCHPMKLLVLFARWILHESKLRKTIKQQQNRTCLSC